jgi:hypothetical protein
MLFAAVAVLLAAGATGLLPPAPRPLSRLRAAPRRAAPLRLRASTGGDAGDADDDAAELEAMRLDLGVAAAAAPAPAAAAAAAAATASEADMLEILEDLGLPVDGAGAAFKSSAEASLREEMSALLDQEFERGVAELRRSAAQIRKENTEAMLAAVSDGSDTALLEESEKRLGAAGDNVDRLVEKVARETGNLQREVENVQRLQAAMKEDRGMTNFKEKGLPARAALAAGLLLVSRGLTEFVLLAGDGDGGLHALPGLAQLLVGGAAAFAYTVL